MRGPSPNMASAGDAIALEELIRTTCLTKRIRPEEFFVDYDKLRSGFVTCKLFHNRISQSKTILNKFLVFKVHFYLPQQSHAMYVFLFMNNNMK